MADRPIIFSGAMVRALLDSRKTQTRRLLKIKGYKGFFQFQPSDTKGYDWTFRRADHVWEDYEHDKLLSLLPVHIGDRLYVREAWAPLDDCKHNDPGPTALINKGFYRADHPCGLPNDILRWRPSIHMPRGASRLTLTVTDVRVQRLQDISEADAWAEGCKRGEAWDNRQGYFPAEEPDPSGVGHIGWDYANEWFADLWNSLHGLDAWDANPWIYAVSFDVHRGNIDTLKRT